MDQDAFRAQLIAEGFKELVLVEREANGAMNDHTHPFEAKALIVRGDIRICTNGAEKTYRAGEIFHLQAYQDHEELYGPEGVVYLVGRR